MADLFATGRIADLILALTVCEAIVLVAYSQATGRGIVAGDLIPNIAAGACLVLALRGALIAASWPMIAAPLAAALIFHLADLYRRWRGRC